MEFYVYTYLDPRKPTGCLFAHEPFYVGKGKGKRDSEHIRLVETDSTNLHKSNRIKAILREGLEPIIVRVRSDLSETEALTFEVELIGKLGRADLGTGPLLNLSDGGEGCCNMSNAGRQVLSERMRGSANPNHDGSKSRGRKRPDNIGRVHTLEAKKRISEARGRDSEETKTKRSESLRKAWGQGREQRCKSYSFIDPQGNEHLVNDGLENFLRKHSLNQPVISRMLRDSTYVPSRGACRGWRVTKR